MMIKHDRPRHLKTYAIIMSPRAEHGWGNHSFRECEYENTVDGSGARPFTLWKRLQILSATKAPHWRADRHAVSDNRSRSHRRTRV